MLHIKLFSDWYIKSVFVYLSFKKKQKEDSYLQIYKLCKFVHDHQGKLKEKTA